LPQFPHRAQYFAMMNAAIGKKLAASQNLPVRYWIAKKAGIATNGKTHLATTARRCGLIKCHSLQQPRWMLKQVQHDDWG
jgi:hypothetical protein